MVGALTLSGSAIMGAWRDEVASQTAAKLTMMVPRVLLTSGNEAFVILRVMANNLELLLRDKRLGSKGVGSLGNEPGGK